MTQDNARQGAGEALARLEQDALALHPTNHPNDLDAFQAVKDRAATLRAALAELEKMRREQPPTKVGLLEITGKRIYMGDAMMTPQEHEWYENKIAEFRRYDARDPKVQARIGDALTLAACDGLDQDEAEDIGGALQGVIGQVERGEVVLDIQPTSASGEGEGKP